jgi:hypothetical protein
MSRVSGVVGHIGLHYLCKTMKPETFEVDIQSKEAKALLKQLQALGIITLRPKKVRSLAEVMADIRAKVKDPLTEEEVMAEVKAVRRSKNRHAAARKPQARR